MDAGPSPDRRGGEPCRRRPSRPSVSGKRCVPGKPSAGRRLGVRQARRCATAEKAFKEVDIVLAVGVRYSEVSTANYSIPEKPEVIQVDANPHVIGRNLPVAVGVNADARLFLDRLHADRARRSAAIRRHASGQEDPAPPRAMTARRTPRLASMPALTRWSSSSTCATAWGRTN